MRIEVMSHGHFMNRAVDPALIMKTYCAVIVEAALDRRGDVDISLALLRRCLLYKNKGVEMPFKVSP